METPLLGGTLPTWWAAVKASLAITGEEMPPNQPVLTYSGNGMSVEVTAADLDRHFERISELVELLRSVAEQEEELRRLVVVLNIDLRRLKEIACSDHGRAADDESEL